MQSAEQVPFTYSTPQPELSTHPWTLSPASLYHDNQHRSLPPPQSLSAILSLTVGHLRAFAGMDLDCLAVCILVLLLFAAFELGVVDRMVRGGGRVFALFCNAVEDAGFALLFGGMVGHDGEE